MNRRPRSKTEAGFAPASDPTTAADPVCAKACGACWACRRAKDGPEWWMKVPIEPKPRTKGPR